MKEHFIRNRICPRCGCSYHEPPALSRLDSNTWICPDCGTREALDTLGISDKEKDDIIAAIHRSQLTTE